MQIAALSDSTAAPDADCEKIVSDLKKKHSAALAAATNDHKAKLEAVEAELETLKAVSEVRSQVVDSAVLTLLWSVRSWTSVEQAQSDCCVEFCQLLPSTAVVSRRRLSACTRWRLSWTESERVAEQAYVQN